MRIFSSEVEHDAGYEARPTIATGGSSCLYDKSNCMGGHDGTIII